MFGEEKQQSDMKFSVEPQGADGNGMSEPWALDRGEGYGVCSDEGQARKSARGMPWHQEPMKDVTSCDKLRGAANEH